MNKNKNVEWALINNIEIDPRIFEVDKQLRGVYGIFVGDECLYIGRSYSIYARLFIGGDCHIKRIIKAQHIDKILSAVAAGKTLTIKILQEVKKQNDHPAKDAQRLASAECYFIDYYQRCNQCLEQYPEGRWD